MTNAMPSKRVLWLLALAPIIAGLGQLAIQQSSLTLLMIHGEDIRAMKPKQAAPEVDLIREIHGDLNSSVLLTSMGLLWAPLTYRLLTKPTRREEESAQAA